MAEEPAATWVRPISLPHEPADERVFDVVVGTQGREIAKWLVATQAEQLSKFGNGLVQFLEEWAQITTSFAVAWDTAFGRAQQALKARSFDATQVAVRVALRLIECGQPGRWSARLGLTDLRVGSFVVRDVVEARADSDGESAEIIALAGRTRVRLVRDRGAG